MRLEICLAVCIKPNIFCCFACNLTKVSGMKVEVSWKVNVSPWQAHGRTLETLFLAALIAVGRREMGGLEGGGCETEA